MEMVGQASRPVELAVYYATGREACPTCSTVTKDLAQSIRDRRIGSRQKRGGCISIFIVLILLFMGGRLLSSWTIDYQWWKEMGQLHTWFSMLAYGVVLIATGLVELRNPPPTVLAELHPTLLWGLVLGIFGGFYTVNFRPGKA